MSSLYENHSYITKLDLCKAKAKKIKPLIILIEILAVYTFVLNIYYYMTYGYVDNTYGLIQVIFFACLAPLLPYIQMILVIKKGAKLALNNGLYYSFYDDYFISSVEGGETTTISYSEINKVYKYLNTILLRVGFLRMVIIKKDGFTKGNAEDFEAFILSVINYEAKENPKEINDIKWYYNLKYYFITLSVLSFVTVFFSWMKIGSVGLYEQMCNDNITFLFTHTLVDFSYFSSISNILKILFILTICVWVILTNIFLKSKFKHKKILTAFSFLGFLFSFFNFWIYIKDVEGPLGEMNIPSPIRILSSLTLLCSLILIGVIIDKRLFRILIVITILMYLFVQFSVTTEQIWFGKEQIVKSLKDMFNYLMLGIVYLKISKYINKYL